MTGPIIKDKETFTAALGNKDPELTGVKEINKTWVKRMGKENDESDEEKEEEQARITENINKITAPKETPELPLVENKSRSPTPEVKNPKKKKAQKEAQSSEGTSSQEKKALHQYDPENTKTEVQREAFLDGFRTKQDYLVVTFKAQMDQLCKIVDTLTSASTSVSRAAADIVDATNLSTSKLASAVTAAVGTSTVTKTEVGQSSSIKGTVKKSDQATPPKKRTDDEVRGLVDANKIQSARIKDVEPLAETVQIPPEVTAVQDSNITLEQLVSIMGCSKETLMTFYKLEEADLKTLCTAMGRSKQVLLKEFGGIGGAKGFIKKMLNAMKK